MRGVEKGREQKAQRRPPKHPVMVVSFSWMGKTSEEQQIWDVWESRVPAGML